MALRWPWKRRPVRLGVEYYGQSFDAVSSGAVGDGLAVASACVLLYQRAIGAARAEGPDWVQRLLTPGVLAQIGRGLALDGEALFLIDGDFGDLRLLPVSSPADVRGGPNPASWMYHVEVPGPTEMLSLDVSGDQVLHFRWSTAASRLSHPNK